MKRGRPAGAKNKKPPKSPWERFEVTLTRLRAAGTGRKYRYLLRKAYEQSGNPGHNRLALVLGGGAWEEAPLTPELAARVARLLDKLVAEGVLIRKPDGSLWYTTRHGLRRLGPIADVARLKIPAFRI